jgi:hypothetical protein
VFQHAKLAGRPEHALDLFEPASRIVYAAEDEPTQDRVKRRGPERQLLHAADDERNSRGAPSGPFQRLQRGVQGNGLRPLWPEGQVPARAGAEVKHGTIRPGHEQAPPLRETAPFAQRAEDLVEPRDLLDAAHYVILTSAITRSISYPSACVRESRPHRHQVYSDGGRAERYPQTQHPSPTRDPIPEHAKTLGLDLKGYVELTAVDEALRT